MKKNKVALLLLICALFFVRCKNSSRDFEGKIDFKTRKIVLPKEDCFYEYINIGWTNKNGEKTEKLLLFDSLHFKNIYVISFEELKVEDSIDFNTLLSSSSSMEVVVAGSRCELSLSKGFNTDTIDSQVLIFTSGRDQ